MSEPLSEAAGCALLARLFRKRGYAIRRNVTFRDYGVSFHIDGWDAAARVGFEFLSSEKEDHEDLTLREFERLKDAEARGELFLFIIDEVEPLSATALGEAAESFLDDVARVRRQSGRSATRQPAGPGRRTAGPAKVPSQTKTGGKTVKKTVKKAGKKAGKKADKKAGASSGQARPTAAKKPAAGGKSAAARAGTPGTRTTRAAKSSTGKRPAKKTLPTGTRRR